MVAVDERCCGHDLLWGGDEDGFRALAEANASAYEARGVELILTTCAECCRTWRMDYVEAVPGYQPQVQHFIEFLEERLDSDELSFLAADGSTAVTYQDPCRLGRHLGVVEAPRRVLGAVPELDLIEMDAHGADALCCGTAGFIGCDAASRRLQRERLEEAAATSAQTMLTSCPKCLVHFACAQEENERTGSGSPSIAVEDLTVFAARLLAAPEPGGESRERTEMVT